MSPRDDAEKAALGAVLNDPARLAELSDWLDPEDFYTPQHQAIYRAMLILDERGAAPDLDPANDGRAQNLATYLLTVAGHVTETGTHLDLPYLHTLMQACPRPENAPHYARMVVEADTHRTIIENATRLAQVTHTHQQTANPWMEDLFIHTAAFRQVLDNLAERWGINPDDLDQPAAQQTAEQASKQAANPRTAAPSDPLAPEFDTAPTPEQRAAAIDREDTVLACILRSPDQINQVRDFLEPDDFTTPNRAACYQAALTLHDRGEPIDPLTLTWETRKHPAPATPSDAPRNAPGGDQTETAPLSKDRLTQLWDDGLPAEVAPYYARQIVDSAIRTATAQAARDLKHLASDPTLTPVDLLTTAAHRIDQTAHHETRWRASRPPEQHPYEQPTERQAGANRGI